MELKKLEERLEQISTGCEKCKAKMCNICPNGKLKASIKDKIKKLNPNSEVSITPLAKILKKLGL